MRWRDFRAPIKYYEGKILEAPEVDTGHWQGVPTEGHPDLVTRELMNVDFTVPIPRESNAKPGHELEICLEDLQDDIQPNLPWADDHFEERVSRVPSNPGVEFQNWPFWFPQKVAFTQAVPDQAKSFKFTHTYQERYWPKWAGYEKGTHKSNVRGAPGYKDGKLGGIRYEYGDLDDLINLLRREPYTRQAYLPIFFPEDTGAVHGGRVPCTLGYHFLLREGKLHMWYFIRSCDVYRHFRDDLYLSARLLLWVISELDKHSVEGRSGIVPGDFHFVCPSLHIHKGDEHRVG